MRADSLILGLLTACTAAAGSVYANDYAAEWRKPLRLELPETTRNIILSGNIDAEAWADQHGITDAAFIRQGRQTLVQCPMSDEIWSAREDALCSAAGVVSCSRSVCQNIQFETTAGNVRNEEAVKARIVRKPPPLEETTAALSEEGGMCRMNRLLPRLDSSDPAPGQDLALQLDLREAPDAGPSPPDSAVADETAQPSLTAEQAPVAPDFAMQVHNKFGDALRLSTDQIPADTTDYTLMVGEGCREVGIPLNNVAPAHVPNLIVAQAGTSAQVIAGRWGLTVISETTLGSTGENLAVYYSTHPIAQTISLMRLDPDVIGVSREHIFTTTAGVASSPSYSDTYARFNYGPEQSGALALHGSSNGEGQTIAIIDTGVAIEHDELAGRVEILDLTDKGWSADAHGTAVAGIIAAAADNALGVYGVAPGANLLALKACQPDSEGGLSARCWTSTLIKALDAAMAKDARIINMSLAGPPDDLLARYVALAVSQNRLIIAGAGNGGSQARPAFPAALPGVVAVTAVDAGFRLYREANRGEYIDLAAPGVDIVTLAPNGDFPSSSGTSWAAAHVSGIAALLYPLMPLSNASDIAYFLTSNSTDLGDPGRDGQFGNGAVDACAAAAAATADAVACPQQGEVDVLF